MLRTADKGSCNSSEVGHKNRHVTKCINLPELLTISLTGLKGWRTGQSLALVNTALDLSRKTLNLATSCNKQ
jgi:hypothetical protein